MPRKSAFKCYFGCTPFIGKVHHFPSPNYPSSEKFAQWKMVLSEMDKAKGDNYIHNNIRICDHHFEKFYLTNIGRLTKNAVPTLNIAFSSSSNYVEPSQMPDPAESTPVQGSSSSSNYVEPSEMSDPAKSAPVQGTKLMTHVAITAPSKRFHQLKAKLLKLRNKCKGLTHKLRQAAKIAQNKSFLKAVEKLPEPAAIFTKMQLSNAFVKSRGRRFTTKEKILCLTILKQSQKGYKLLQKLFALPSQRTMLKVLSKISLKPGVNDIILYDLKKTVKKLPIEKRLCTLIFDEMALSPGLYFNKFSDQIIGFEDFGSHKTNKIADHCLVFMIKGLKGKYKQPISYTFCQSATKSDQLKKIVREILLAVQSTGLKVIATVCDQSPTNMRVIKSLIEDTREKYVSEGKEYKSLAFELDGTGKVFPIFDSPHLLKGIRNNLLTKEARYVQNGQVKYAKWCHLQMLLDADPGEDDIRLINKLTENHVIKDKIPKMKVKYAAQVFSQKVSSTMRYLSNHGLLPKECADTADLLLLFDRLFDSFNSHSYNNSEKPYKCALKHNSPHHKLWNDTLPVLRSMQFKVDKKLSDGTLSSKYVQVPSIKNWVSNINVFKEMFIYLQKMYKISSLLTRNVNQDPLENFFCNIRSNGVRNTSPTCSQFIGAFKTLMINNLTSPHSFGANCEQDHNKPLQSLKSLLNYKQNKTNEPNNIINVDSIINNFMQTSQMENSRNSINKEAKRYVAGYIVKKCIQKVTKKCHICRMHLMSTAPPNNKDYILTIDYTRRSLNYPSEALCGLVDDVCMIIQIILNDEPQQKYLRATLKQIINIFCDFSYFSCKTHTTTLQDFLMDTIISIIINSWCTNVNRLLKGKANICQSNVVKIQALNYYKKRNKRKN